MESPDLLPPSEGDVRLALTPIDTRVGAFTELPASLTTVSDRPQTFDSRSPTPVARTSDRWIVRGLSGWSDPSPWWEDAGLARGIPEPLRIDQSGPVEWTIPLSDWVRFDAPGRYAAQVVTNRGAKEVVSNPVLITVSARDPAKDAAALERLQAALDEEQTPAQRSRTFRELAALGTPETRDLALDRLAAGTEDESGWVLVLIRNPDIPATRSALQAALSDPDVDIGHGHIRVFEALAYDEAFETSNPPRLDALDSKRMAERREQMDARRDVRDQARQAAFDASYEALDTKSSPGASLGTLGLMAGREELENESRVWTRVRTGLGQIPEPAIGELLSRWFDDLVEGGPLDPPSDAVVEEVTAGLLAVLERPEVRPATRVDALRRLVELDTLGDSAVQQAIEAVIADPSRAFPDADPLLRALPAVSSSTQDAILAGLATATDPVQQARLLGQYVDAEHGEAVRAAYTALPDDAPTGVLAGYLAWFLQHAPDGPEAKALLGRFGPEHPFLLNFTAEIVDDASPLEPLAMQGLRSPDQAVCFKSSDFLIDYGSPERKPEILALLPRVTGQNEEGTMGALVAARGWLIDNKTRNTIGPTLTDKRADMVLRSASSKDQQMVIVDARVEGGRPVIELNHRDYVGAEAIEQKFSQFDPKTTVKLKYHGVDPNRAPELFGPPLSKAGVTLYVPEQP